MQSRSGIAAISLVAMATAAAAQTIDDDVTRAEQAAKAAAQEADAAAERAKLAAEVARKVAAAAKVRAEAAAAAAEAKRAERRCKLWTGSLARQSRNKRARRLPNCREKNFSRRKVLSRPTTRRTPIRRRPSTSSRALSSASVSR